MAPRNTFSPIPQPFDESSLRSPVSRSPIPQPSDNSNVSLVKSTNKPRKTHCGQPQTPPRMLNLGEFQHSPDVNSSGASIRRRVTPQDPPKPQVKREDSTRKRPRTAAPSIASEDDEEENEDVRFGGRGRYYASTQNTSMPSSIQPNLAKAEQSKQSCKSLPRNTPTISAHRLRNCLQSLYPMFANYPRLPTNLQAR